MKTKMLPYLLAGCMFASSGFSQLMVDLTQGTNTVMGAFTGKYELELKDEKTHRLNVDSNVGFGHFVFDNFMAGAALTGAWNLSDGFKNAGVKLMSTYFFDTYTGAFPYLGVNLDPSYNIKLKNFMLKAGVHTGVLVSLSESVALDFGLGADLSIKIKDTDTWKVSVPFGFLGLRAFF